MRYLASDLDGTLVHDNKVHEDDIKAIQKLKQSGHKFIISTGRSLRGASDVLKNYNIDYDYLLLCNGGLIIDKDNNIILDEWISNEVANKIINDYYDYHNTLVYVDNSEETILIRNDNADTKKVLGLFDYFSHKLDIEEVRGRKDNFKIMSVFMSDEDIHRAEKIKNEIADKYGDIVEVYRNQYFIDIAPKNCSKGQALLKILELEGKSKDDIYTIGDSFNDISMFNITENSYTFNHAEESIKEHAKNKVDYVHELISEILN